MQNLIRDKKGIRSLGIKRKNARGTTTKYMKKITEIEFSPSYKDFMECEKRWVILKGGAGSGKSYHTAFKIILRLIHELNFGCLVVRKIQSTVNQSVFKLFTDILRDTGLSELFTINKTEKIIRLTTNPKNFIKFLGVDDPEKLKSITGINNIWIEEATEFDFADIEQLATRARELGYKPTSDIMILVTKRYKKKYESNPTMLEAVNKHCFKVGDITYEPSFQQIILTFNPVSSRHWIKEKFWDKIDSDIAKFSTNYQDNPYLSPDVIKEYLKYDKDSDYYRVYVEGEWGNASNNSSLIHKFSLSKMGEFTNDLELPLHISLDFNVQPHCTMIVGQWQNNKLVIIDEFISPYPGTTKELVLNYLEVYNNPNQVVYIYGDPAGKNNNTRGQGNDYQIVIDFLNQYNIPHEYSVASSHPSVNLSARFLNELFDGSLLMLNKKCRMLADDLSYLKIDPKTGGKLIEYDKNSDGVRYEKFGHFTDTLRYLVTGVLNDEWRSFLSRKQNINYDFGLRKSEFTSDKIFGDVNNYDESDDDYWFLKFQ